MSKEHRWSGWPGAYCLDCGAGDPGEDALAHGCDDPRCVEDNELYCMVEGHTVIWKDCGDHKETECLSSIPTN
jgi:hypothetical protein